MRGSSFTKLMREDDILTDNEYVIDDYGGLMEAILLMAGVFEW